MESMKEWDEDKWRNMIKNELRVAHALNVKVQNCPVPNEGHREGLLGSGGMTVGILNLSTRQR